jgi:cyclophilin family peptidyl-prolyl cis-trans isomerase
MKTAPLAALWALWANLAFSAAPEVGPVPDDLRRGFDLDPFYRQALRVGDLPIVASDRVSAAALREAQWIVGHLLEGRADIVRAMAQAKTRLAVMAWNEFTTDIPEHRHLEPRIYWDRRARGLGATPEAPAVSCAEENLLGFPGDPYSTENILIHEFAHAIHEMAMKRLDATFDPRLTAAFHTATNRGLWKGTYAGTNPEEYWAEGVQSWFDDNRQNDALHNDVNTRAELKAYDPELARLCAEVLGDRPWRYRKPALREPGDRAHLAGFEASTSPRFRWREEPIPDHPRVLIQTALGDIEVELDRTAAPTTVSNFLHYVHQGLYADGAIFRTVTASNQPRDEVKIAVIQAQADAARAGDFLPPIPLERTRDTGLKHRDGTLSMARDGPDTARDHFFICIADQPQLNFGGQRNPDGQGFAAFGRVVKGMETVRRIHGAPAEGQQLKPPIRIQRAIRLR